MSESKAAERADKAALKYAGKQHRYRAETIVLTENAYAYNRGAHMGVSQSIADGYMGRCAMIWTTAGTNRVCSRCSELRIKIQRGEDLLRADFAGMTAYEDIGRIDLTPHAFLNEEQLVRTIIHEGCHVKQLKKYGREYVQMNILHMEKTAKRYEDFFTRLVKRRTSNVPTSKVDRYFL